MSWRSGGKCTWGLKDTKPAREPSQAFPHGFVDTIYFPMRKGIRHIVVRRKSK